MSDWKFELEDLEDDVDESEGANGSEVGGAKANGAEIDDSGTNGMLSPPVEPGSPNAENVAFVLLGVAAAVYVLTQVLL